ncbi:DUF1731 domain-containing protein [Ornithinimicrobium cavernae]|uniref:DUF1731 domain-containing protein n=1 Tax=Ornithinimicrobium cavernae TaxID=2666047 RepID=UPI000D69013D|nr:DUF1731 domain-containing protein [Ornithinimicrobium cavernae]
MTWQRTLRHYLAIPADELWEVVGDPTRWPAWSRAIRSFTLEPGQPHEYAGAHVSHTAAVAEAQLPHVVPGQLGHYLPARGWAAALHGRTAGPLRLTEVDPGRSLAFEQPASGGATRVRWALQEHPDGGTMLEQQVTVTGPMTPAIVLSLGTDLLADWPLAVTRLYRMLRPEPDHSLLKVVIAGGSGTLGRSLAADLATRGHDVVLLTRAVNLDLPHRQLTWDGMTVGPWAEELAQDPARTAVVNLAGRLVDARPTEANIAELRESRVRATRALVQASQQLETRLARWVQGSTTAIWSDAGETRLTESSPVPTGAAALPQMTGVAEPWEEAASGASTEHLTILRTSIVLQNGSPALDRLTGLTRAGLGGRVGSGLQWFSWIHVQDWLALTRAALGLEPDVELPDGILVAAAPNPVRNRELMATLRERFGRPAAPPTPTPLVHVGGVVLRTDPALGLTGRHATSEVTTEAGFEFAYPTLDGALRDLTS